MRRARRNFLIGAGAILGLGLAASLSEGLHDWMLHQIRMEFGDAIADSPETERFMTDYIVFLKATHGRQYQEIFAYFRLKPPRITFMPDAERSVRNNLFNIFLRSTNAIRCLEVGDEFVFVAIFDPDRNPCVNQLGAFAL